MIKKIFLFFVLFLFTFSVFATDCKFEGDYLWDVNNCLSSTNLVNVQDATIEEWFKNVVASWVTVIAWFFLLVAVWSIVYGWFMMTISWAEDEKIKKWKDIVKWWILWALWIVTASTIITIIIKVFFWAF